MAIVIGTGGIDLSVGSVMAIAGQVGRWCCTTSRSCWPSSPPCWCRPCCGVFNGTLVARFGVQPIIATLILFIAGRGIAQLITGGELQPLSNPDFQWIGLARPLRGARAGDHRRRRGRASPGWSCGSPSTGARARRRRQRDRRPARGRPAARVKLLVYVTSGVLAGLVGLIAVSATSASDANNTGVGIELDAIAAVAVAGTPLTGGRVTVMGRAWSAP